MEGHVVIFGMVSFPAEKYSPERNKNIVNTTPNWY
jgi:hypothetical protein